MEWRVIRWNGGGQDGTERNQMEWRSGPDETEGHTMEQKETIWDG